MTTTELSKKLPWIKIVSVIVALCFVSLAIGCEPMVSSLVDPKIKVTRAQLQIEMDHFIARFEYKLATISQKERFRKLLLDNAAAIAQSGTVNPYGIVTAVLAFYGFGSAATSVKNGIKNRKKS